MLTASRLKIVTEDLKKHTKLVSDMRKDLDYIFKKVRNIKSRINTRYPEALERISNKSRKNQLSEEADEVAADQTNDTENKVAGSATARDEGKTSEEKITSKYSLDNTTVQYVQMQQTPEDRTPNNDHGTSSSNEAKSQTKAPDESTDNESSDCATDTA